MHVFFFFLCILIWRVFLCGRPACAVFLALSVFRNMAERNVHDPLLRFEDVMAAGDEDEAIVDDCYEAATNASDYAGSISGVTVTTTKLNTTQLQQPRSRLDGLHVLILETLIRARVCVLILTACHCRGGGVNWTVYAVG